MSNILQASRSGFTVNLDYHYALFRFRFHYLYRSLPTRDVLAGGSMVVYKITLMIWSLCSGYGLGSERPIGSGKTGCLNHGFKSDCSDFMSSLL